MYRREKFHSNRKVNLASLGKTLHDWNKRVCGSVCVCVCVCVCVVRKIWSSENFDYLIYFLLIQAWAIQLSA